MELESLKDLAGNFTVCITWAKDLMYNSKDQMYGSRKNMCGLVNVLGEKGVLEFPEEYERRWTSENVVRELFANNAIWQFLRRQGVTNLLTVGMGNSKSHICGYTLEYHLTLEQIARYKAKIHSKINGFRFGGTLDKRFRRATRNPIHKEEGWTEDETREMIVELTLRDQSKDNTIMLQVKDGIKCFAVHKDYKCWYPVIKDFLGKQGIEVTRRRLMDTPFGQLRRLLGLN